MVQHDINRITAFNKHGTPFVVKNEANQSERKVQIVQWCAAHDAFVAEHGLPFEEESPF